ncbi:MAG: NAD-dependent epimerase/dehydratase family protein [Planctomycetota bacterium]
MRVLVTGGAGFVGAHLALSFRDAGCEVSVLDNLHRRGAELNLPLLRAAGVEFVHGDIRCPDDLAALGRYDWLIEASAEPSVHAGVGGSPAYCLHTNLVGTLNCLEYARRSVGGLVFLSTSRVYSIAPLRELALAEAETRFELSPEQRLPGVSPSGISESFPVGLPRSFYGASKLAAEMLVQEYAEAYGLRTIIDRCGVIAGPGQFGKVDQGVFTLWVARHLFGGGLSYTGFGGEGKQVRDLLHPADLFALLLKQMNGDRFGAGAIYNVGGGPEHSVSLLEYTQLCQEVCAREVEVARRPETSPVDIPCYVSDARRVTAEYDWRPLRSPRVIVGEIRDWALANEAALRPILG